MELWGHLPASALRKPTHCPGRVLLLAGDMRQALRCRRRRLRRHCGLAASGHDALQLLRGCSLNGSYEVSGLISGRPTAPGTYTFDVTASLFPCIYTVTHSYTIQVMPHCGMTVGGSLPTGVATQSYQAAFTVMGGVGPYSFRIATGRLPSGLTLSSWGAVQGVPTEVGQFSFDLEVTDSQGCTSSASFNLDITCPPFQVLPGRLSPATVAVPYDIQLSVSGGLPPVLFSLENGTLPPGLNLHWSGRLSGTPLSTGSSQFRIRALDSMGCTALRDHRLDVLGTVNLLMGMGAADPNPNQARILDSLWAPAVDIVAYGAGRWGTEVATGRLDGSIVESIVTGPGPGPVLGPHVRAFDAAGSAISRISFFAYGTLLWGVIPGTSELEGDAIGEIVTGAGPGAVFGPHVRGFDVDSGAPRPMAGVNYFAYATLKYGVHVAGGDLDGDSRGDLATAPGPGAVFGPTVRGWRFAPPIVPMTGVSFDAFAGSRFGARVAAGDVDGDGIDDLLAGRGSGPAEPAQARGFEFDGGAVKWLAGFDTTVFPSLHGVSVASGDIDRDGSDDLVAGAGPDPAADSTVRWLTYSPGSLSSSTDVGPVFPGSAFGVRPGAGHFDY